MIKIVNGFTIFAGAVSVLVALYILGEAALDALKPIFIWALG